MDVNFEYYKIFYYVAKYHNFTKAAQALNNSQPNITRAMNCLEQQLNTTLFIRTNRGVQLTPEGERLYTHVLSAMEQFQAAEEELADSSGLSHGSVAIGASETALNIFLSAMRSARSRTFVVSSRVKSSGSIKCLITRLLLLKTDPVWLRRK